MKKGVGKTNVEYTFILGGGGERERRTTLKWRADNQKVGDRRAREKEKVDGRGRRERQPNGPQLSNSLMLGTSEGPSRGIGDHHTTRQNAESATTVHGLDRVGRGGQ